MRTNLTEIIGRTVEGAGACLACAAPAPCVAACPQHAPILTAMRLLAHAASTAEPRGVWMREAERDAVEDVTQALWAAYW
ncbi:MAG: hypothetical protein NTY23_14820 [Chloroflexi bacterium]|nr:hypothetical protein [Chloroflexota bacterium]